jgi:hypothetical protein
MRNIFYGIAKCLEFRLTRHAENALPSTLLSHSQERLEVLAHHLLPRPEIIWLSPIGTPRGPEASQNFAASLF